MQGSNSALGVALALASSLALAACPTATRGPGASPRGTSEIDRRPAPYTPPRLVVVVVIDQLASWVLDRHLPHLSEAGAIRGGAARGAFHHRVALPFAGTYTGPGHVAIVTGASARESGVATNTIYSARRGARVAITDDGQHRVHGVDAGYASPAVLRVDSVADRLREATGGGARVVSVSFKDRAAVLAGGQRPDIALWYEVGLPGMTTSTYYAESLPAWLLGWQRAHPVADLLTPWTPENPELYARVLGADDAPGEGDYLGLGPAFPHDATRTTEPFRAIRLFPRATEYLLDLARECAERYRLGGDAVTDLLIVSISALDYTGHVFGAESWEYLDNLIRTDVALGQFLAALAPADEIAVLITADHGVARLPERTPGGGASARIFADEMIATLDAAAPAPGTVIHFAKPFVYLADAVRSDPARRAAAVRAVIERLVTMPGVWNAYDVAVAREWHRSDDPVKRAVALSIPPETDADVFVVLAPGAMIDEDMARGAGSSHGTPWAYDTEVPVIFWGPGVTPSATTEPLAHARVAATIAALLGTRPPTHARVEPLPGAPAPAR